MPPACVRSSRESSGPASSRPARPRCSADAAPPLRLLQPAIRHELRTPMQVDAGVNELAPERTRTATGAAPRRRCTRSGDRKARNRKTRQPGDHVIARRRRVRRERRRAAEARARHPAQRRRGNAILAVVARRTTVGSPSGRVQLEHLATSRAEERQPGALAGKQRRLELQVGEARHRAVLESIGDQPIVGAAGRGPPRAGVVPGMRPSTQHIAARQADRPGRGQRASRRAVARFEVDDRRQAAAEARVEPGRIERDVGAVAGFRKLVVNSPNRWAL